MIKSIISFFKNAYDAVRIRKLIDAKWYAERYQIGQSKLIPAFIHYAFIGWKLNNDPNPEFSTEGYIQNYPDVEKWGGNPFVHYVKYGRIEGRSSLTDKIVCQEIFQEYANKKWKKQHPNSQIWLSIIVPTYNTPIRYLEDILNSFNAQKVNGVELIFSDDGSTNQDTIEFLKGASSRGRVKLVFAKKNEGISATINLGLAKAVGKWVTILDHDDVIAPHALNVIQDAILKSPKAEFFYTDEVIVDDYLNIRNAFWKPAYDPVLLSGMNYINHFSIYRTNKLKELNGCYSEYDGSQDYECLLRYLKLVSDKKVIHIPYPAYLWRRSGETYSTQFIEKATQNARQALLNYYDREGIDVSVNEATLSHFHKVDHVLQDSELPMISIIIPNINSYKLIVRLLEGIFVHTDYPSFEIIIIDNGTTDGEVLDLYESYSKNHPNFSFYINNESFNFSRSVNKGIKKAKGKHYLLLNNDIEIISNGWLKEMVSCLQYKNAGIVGAKLLYENDNIQHVGVITGLGGLAGHWYHQSNKDEYGLMGRLTVRNSMTCVTGAAILISGECLDQVGLFDEKKFAIAYNDVDFCMRAYKAGFRIIWTPYACLYHLESVTRGYEDSPEKQKRFQSEAKNLAARHKTKSFLDPAYHPILNRDHALPSVEYKGQPLESRTWW